MINADKPNRWDADTKQSVLQYNDWFMDFAPKAFQSVRGKCLQRVEDLFRLSDNMNRISADLLVNNPQALTVLRAMCAPPIAEDRLAGLAGVSRSQVRRMEEGRLPSREKDLFISNKIPALLKVISRLIDKQLMCWLDGGDDPADMDLAIAQSVIADRLHGSTSNPVTRNAQEERQLKAIENYLQSKSYRRHDDPAIGAFEMPHGTYSFHKNVRMFKNARDDSDGYVNTPIDVVIMPLDPSADKPLLVECKSAGDFVNTNKRRKEEDTKVTQLRATYGDDTILYLFLCGYFESTYLDYVAANHMDWIWEHRVTDFEEAGI